MTFGVHVVFQISLTEIMERVGQVCLAAGHKRPMSLVTNCRSLGTPVICLETGHQRPLLFMSQVNRMSFYVDITTRNSKRRQFDNRNNTDPLKQEKSGENSCAPEG